MSRNIGTDCQPTTRKDPEERRHETVLFLTYFSGKYTIVASQRNFHSQKDCKLRHFLLKTI
jgi:hypothetical protein